MPLALEGIRILDFSQIAIGPSCTQLLGDLGADVIKVERPGMGEWGRLSTRFGVQGDENYLFLGLNRNKRSIALDLGRPGAKEIVYKLAARCDVAVQNFRPGVMDRLGLGYKDLKQHNPRLIYASASGHGLSGPYVYKPGQDLIAQSLGGVMSVTGCLDGPPTPCGASIADYIGGLLLAQGITTALLCRERTGIGQELDVALLDTQIALQFENMTSYASAGTAQRPGGTPLYRVYKTRDGHITLVGAFKSNPLQLVCEALGLEDLSKDPRFDTQDKMYNVNYKELEAILEQAFGQKTTAECVEALEEKDFLIAPVNNFADVMNDPQVQHNKMIVEIDHPRVGKFKAPGTPIRFSETPAAVRMPPPSLGQHTDEILAWLGFGAEEITELRARKVVA